MRKTSVHWMLLAVLAFAPTAVLAQQPAPAKAEEPKKEQPQKQEDIQKQAEEPKKEEDAKLTQVPGGKALGMSILGNQEAPKALVIVPWKTSELGASMGISPLLDDSKQPVDREVFLRALSYYAIRSEDSAAQSTTASRRSK